jgi:5-methylthioadenosine/S-adenosylhomocysteine deaminase
MTTIVRAGLLVDCKRRSADPADILIDGDTIVTIGPPGLAAPEHATNIDATNRLLIPGLVNAHTHSHANLPRSLGDRWTLELALHCNPAARRSTTNADKHLGALLGAVEMIRKGCTACYDLFYEFPAPSIDGLIAVGRAYADSGMRAVVAPMMADRSFYDAVPGLRDSLPDSIKSDTPAPEASQASLETVRAVLRNWPFDRDQVRLALAPTIPAHCSDGFLAAVANTARDNGIGWHTHLAESKVQAVAGLRRYGRTLTSQLQAMGVLGPEFTAAHAVWLDGDDRRRLADAGCCIAHNPVSNMRYGSGIADVRAMREVGLTVGVGTDSRSCSDNLNMFEAMRSALYTSRVLGPDYHLWLGSAEAFEMATEGSARVLGMADQIGRLAPGYKADIVFLDRRNTNYIPLNDVVNQIVMAEDGTAVDSVMIGGRMVLHHGRLVTVDYDALLIDVDAAWERLRAANAEELATARKLEELVGSFCVGLATSPYHVHRYCGAL